MTHAVQAVDSSLACPACGGSLADGDLLACSGCGREYRVVAGIPDLRLSYPDPYASWDEDLARARRLEEVFDEVDFEGLLREHWRSNRRAPELVDRFVAGDLAAEGKAEQLVVALERHLGRPLDSGDEVLEVGCGSAAFALACARRGASVVATDVSMDWLVLARKRLQDAGDDVRLVCCAAEEPPFRPASFDIVGAVDVIEHVGDQARFAMGCAAMLREGGALFLTTPNRFSLGLEPHVRLWGVGYMPRRAARAYVSTVRKSPYDHVRLLSARSLRRLLAGAGLSAQVVVPEIPEASQSLYHGLELRLVRAYNRARRLAPARRVLVAVGPFFHVFATRRPA